MVSSEQERRVTDWRTARRWEDGRAEGSSAIGDGGQATISLTPEVDGTGSGFLAGFIYPTLLKK